MPEWLLKKGLLGLGKRVYAGGDVSVYIRPLQNATGDRSKFFFWLKVL